MTAMRSHAKSRLWRASIAKALVGVALGAIALGTPAVASASADTLTTHFTFADPPGPGANPCTGVPGVFSVSGSGVMHTTANPDGTLLQSLTFRAHLLLVQDDGVIFSGQAVSHDEQLVNKETAVFGLASHLIFFGSDGTKLSQHMVFHLSVNANGTVTVFVFRDTLRCD
jgi:hypothetical protein